MLQTLCLTTRSSFDVIEDWVESTLLLPDPLLSEAVSFALCLMTLVILVVTFSMHVKP